MGRACLQPTIAAGFLPSSTDGWHRVPIHVFKPSKGGIGTITLNFTGTARLWCRLRDIR